MAIKNNNENNAPKKHYKLHEYEEAGIYVLLKNTDFRKYYKLKIAREKCYIKRFILPHIFINDIFINEKVV